MINERIPWHVAWRREYGKRRYAQHLSQVELNARIRDIMANLLILTREAKFGLLPINQQTGVWMEKWTHLLEEMQLRHGPYPNGFTRDIFQADPLPDFASELAKKAAKRMSVLGLKKGDLLIKFGKRVYMEDLYEKGMLRLQPATFFGQAVHNGAIKDDELTRRMSLVLTREDVVKLVLNPQDVPDEIPWQRVDVQFRSQTDYWLYCLTSSVEPRLFVDFQADACVIITNRASFGRKLRLACSQNLFGATMQEGPAVYVDPLLPASAKIDVPFVKHFKYSYQDEYRYCWLPRSPATELCPVDVQIGSLAEIGDLVLL